MGKKIIDIQVLDAEKRRVPSKHYVYVILVTWNDGSALTVFRRYSRFFDLQTKLLNQFPVEGGAADPGKRDIPFLPGKIFLGRSHIKDVAMKRLKEIDEYCKRLVSLPPHISECDEVLSFFEVEPDDLEPPSAEGKKKLSLSISLNSLSKSKGTKEKKAEKISKPKRLTRYVAVAEYKVQAHGEVALYPGLSVEVLEKSDSGWWFVNSEDEQGWAPSTYLEPENGATEEEDELERAQPGQEENYICIGDFTGASNDEISLTKGAVVQVLQKSMDGWWLVRYQGREAYAPGTYLKKAANSLSHSLVEKSRLSGVEIVSSLQDISTLLNQDAGESKTKGSSPTIHHQGHTPPSQKKQTSSAVFKQKSLERGGSLIPPPRQNSIQKMTPPMSVNKSNVYVTVESFEDSVGDGLSFSKGMKVQVIEKTSTGWWFVQLDEMEGWVPASYLEPCPESAVFKKLDPFYDVAAQNIDPEDSDDDNWYAEPEEEEPKSKSGPELIAVNPGKRPLPALPKEDEESCEISRKGSRPLPPPPAQGGAKPVSKPNLGLAVKAALGKPPDIPKSSGRQESSNTSQGAKPGAPPNDLASVLKSKFESRSHDAARPSDTLESQKKKESTGNSVQPPMLPSKPSEIKKNFRHVPENTESKPVSNPASAVKLKHIEKPTVDKPEPHKHSFPSVALKPNSKPGLNGKTTDVPTVAAKNASNNSPVHQSSNVKTAEKPALAVKPKPATMPKPSVAAKPTIASKPKVPSAGTPSAPGVSNLANSLSSQLHFGSNVSQNEPKHTPSKKSIPPPMAKPFSPKKPSSPAQSPPTCTALYDFVAQNDGEISFNEGDELEILEEEDEWSLVRCWDEEGWAPTNYLKKE